MRRRNRAHITFFQSSVQVRDHVLPGRRDRTPSRDHRQRATIYDQSRGVPEPREGSWKGRIATPPR